MWRRPARRAGKRAEQRRNVPGCHRPAAPRAESEHPRRTVPPAPAAQLEGGSFALASRPRALQAPSPPANSDTGAVQRHANEGPSRRMTDQTSFDTATRIAAGDDGTTYD